MLKRRHGDSEAVLGSGEHGNDPSVAHRVMLNIAERVLYLTRNKFKFDHIHQRITEPYDYYQFGQVSMFSLGRRCLLLSRGWNWLQYQPVGGFPAEKLLSRLAFLRVDSPSILGGVKLRDVTIKVYP
jgi:hypothetical protein